MLSADLLWTICRTVELLVERTTCFFFLSFYLLRLFSLIVCTFVHFWWHRIVHFHLNKKEISPSNIHTCPACATYILKFSLWEYSSFSFCSCVEDIVDSWFMFIYRIVPSLYMYAAWSIINHLWCAVFHFEWHCCRIWNLVTFISFDFQHKLTKRNTTDNPLTCCTCTCKLSCQNKDTWIHTKVLEEALRNK